MNTGVDNLIESNQQSADKHRIAYGEAMYNQAISDAIALINDYIDEIGRHSPTAGNLQSISNFQASINRLTQLLKPSQPQP